MKHRIALLAAAALIATAVVASSAFGRSHRSTANTITVNMIDFSFKMKKPAVVKHGVKYTVTEINKGNAAHNIDFLKVKRGAIIAPGKKSTFTVVFKKAGKYQYVCDVPRHAELGMAGTLVVK